MASNLSRRSSIDGVALGYMRDSSARKVRSASFTGSSELWAALQRFKRDLHLYTNPAGYGDIKMIVSAGIYVNKPGQHGRGSAVDIDRIIWTSGKTCSPIYGVHAHSKQWARLRYYALDAVCRQHFRYVLDGNYNAAHRDHIHADLGGMPIRPLSTSSRAEVVFLQAVCNEFAGQNLAVDGQYGPKSANGLKNTLSMAGLGHLSPLTSTADHRKFLQRVSQKGFRGQTFRN